MKSVLRLEAKYLRGERLSASELDLASKALDAPSPLERIVASEALLRSRVEHRLMTKATKVLESMCRESIVSEADPDTRLVLSMFYIPGSVLLESQAMKEFTFKAAASKAKGPRTNAQLVLRKLAAGGDKGALRALRAAATDPDVHVSHNALSCLDQLDKAANGSGP